MSSANVLKAAAATVVLALALSCVYGPLDYYSPLVYLNMILAALMGIAIGRGAKAMLRRFRIAGKGAATFVAAAGALVAVWFSWLTYLWALSGYDFSVFTDFADPAALWDLMGYISENPVWSLSRRGKEMSDAPGMMYYGAWLVEAGLFVYFAAKECRNFVRDNKLCPQCGEWLRPTGDVALFAAPADAAAFATFSGGDLSLLKTLPRLEAGAQASEWLTVLCYACAACEGRNAHVTVGHTAVKLNKKKKPEQVKTVIANMVEISPELEAEIFTAPAPVPVPAETPQE